MVHKSPTVVPYPDFNANDDAEALKKAMKGFGTDEDAITAILSKRTNKQRQKIIEAYKGMYGKDLVKHLKKELGGNFEKVVVALMTPSEDYLAKEFHEAIEGIGTDEGALVEILAGSSNEDIHELGNAYQRLYEKTLEEAISSDCSGDFKNILVALAQGSRNENAPADEEKALEDAEKLYQAGEGKLGTDESEFIRVMCTSSYKHLCEVQKQYKQISGNSLKDAVKSEFSGNMEKVLRAVLSCSKKEPKYFAERLHNAMEGFGTREGALIRIIVSRSEIDLGEIKAEYQKKHERTLEQAIESETSGDFKRMLLALL